MILRALNTLTIALGVLQAVVSFPLVSTHEATSWSIGWSSTPDGFASGLKH